MVNYIDVKDMNIFNKMVLKLVEANNFNPVVLTEEELRRDIKHIEVLHKLDEVSKTMTISFRNLE